MPYHDILRCWWIKRPSTRPCLYATNLLKILPLWYRFQTLPIERPNHCLKQPTGILDASPLIVFILPCKTQNLNYSRRYPMAIYYPHSSPKMPTACSLWQMSLWWIPVLLSLLAYCYQWFYLFHIWPKSLYFNTEYPIGIFGFRYNSASKCTSLKVSSSRQLPYVPPIRSLHPYFKMLVLRSHSYLHIDAPLLTLIRVFNAHKYGKSAMALWWWLRLQISNNVCPFRHSNSTAIIYIHKACGIKYRHRCAIQYKAPSKWCRWYVYKYLVDTKNARPGIDLCVCPLWGIVIDYI